MASASQPAVHLDSIVFQYARSQLIRSVSLSVPRGQLITLLGPSGCGKTTILKLIGGYLQPSSGTISIQGRDVTRLPPEERNAGMVFQNYALFPHLSAFKNVSFGLEVRRVPRVEREQRVKRMLERVGLQAEEYQRKPAELSGGQQQRVALARALIIEPDVLLLDEPLANLDRQLREQLRAELRKLQRETGVSTVMVTHDQEEALAISDQIAVVSGGRILQVGPVLDVYLRPRTSFVARFLGAANLIPGKFLGQTAALVMVRPEHCRVDPNPATCRWCWQGRITEVAFLGADLLATVVCDNGVPLRVRTRSGRGLALGEEARVGFGEAELWVIPETDTE